MEQRILGRTGRPVSVVGLGTWQLGGDWGDVDEPAALDVLAAAVDAGVTLFDTADVYGDGRSEQLIGRFLREHPDTGSSSPPRWAGGPTRCPRTTCSRTSATGTTARGATSASTRLDLVQLHCPPTRGLPHDEVFDALDTMVDEGRIAALRRQRRDASTRR